MLAAHKSAWPKCVIFLSYRDFCVHVSNTDGSTRFFATQGLAPTPEPKSEDVGSLSVARAQKPWIAREYFGSEAFSRTSSLFHEIQHGIYLSNSRPTFSIRERRSDRLHGKRSLHRSVNWHVAAHENLYATLGVDKNVTMEDLKGAYHALAKKHHPDISQHDKKESPEVSHDRFVKINEAFMVLSDPKKRRQYDMDMSGPQAAYANSQQWGNARARYPHETHMPPGYSGGGGSRARQSDFFDEYGCYTGDTRGARGKPFISNTAVVFLALAWMLGGLAFHMWRFAESHEEVTVLFEERSMAASEVLHRAQARARENGSQLQLAMLRDKTQPDKPQAS
eukprot:m.279650 g.279650  ORF g.279650 m.279650 type:complete len:337 (+) comp19808_c0_seq6:190-1200(+)